MQWQVRFVHRETVLLALLIGIAVVAFAVTRAVAQKNRDVRLRDAAMWQQRSIRELDAGRPRAAADALRRAVATNPESHRYQLELARALRADEQDDQARQVLLRLREQQPEDADVNLELARLEARGDDAAAAVRYYQHTLAAQWSDQYAESRQQVRMEMIDFLLRHSQPRRALAELLVLIPTLPDDGDTRTRVGQMFLEAGDARRALDQFTAVLRVAADHGPALAGAGEAAFDLGDYARARAYLARVPESTGRIGELRTITEFVLTRDPLAPRIGATERRRRLVADLDDVSRRLTACADHVANEPRPGHPDVESLRAELETFRETLTPRTQTIARDLAEDGLDLIVRIERAVDGVCGAPTPLDQAVLLIGRRHDVGFP